MGFFELARRNENSKPKPAIEKPRIEEEIHAKAMIDFINPFSKQNLERVWINIWKNYEGNIVFDACIKYTSGSSSGEHKVTADSFQALVDKINLYITNIGA